MTRLATQNRYALVVAGGNGNRMKTDVPKQFLVIAQQPIVVHTLEKFYSYSPNIQIILVLPSNQIEKWKAIVKQFPDSRIHRFTHPIMVVAGGSTRFQSVKNGLEAIKDTEGLVAIHDGVRPFVSLQTIDQSFQMAHQKGSAVTVIIPKDSIRKLEKETSISQDRSIFRLVQTPQTFQLKLLKKAYQQQEKTFFTDDASVVEAANFPIYLVEGSYENIKITTPEDMLLAEYLFKNNTI